MSSKSDRVVYLDILRILACFLVVMVHISAQRLEELSSSSSSFIIHSSYNTLAFSGVALFFMISGALILNPNRHYSIRKMVFKALHIYIIYFIWKLFYMLFDAFILGYKIDGAFIKNSIINLISKTGYYHLWFLPAIAVIYLFVPLIKKSVENDKQVCRYFVIVFFIVSIFASTAFHFDFKFKYTVQDFYNLNDFSLFTGYLGFFVLGHYLNRYADSMNEVVRIIMYILGLVMIPASGFIDSYLSHGKPGSLAMNTPFSLPSFFITLAIFLFVMNNFSSKRNASLLTTLSGITLGVYLIHPVFIVLCGKIGLTSSSFHELISIPVITILVTLASGLVAFVISKIPVAKKLVIMTAFIAVSLSLITLNVQASPYFEPTVSQNSVSSDSVSDSTVVSENEVHESSQYELYVNRGLGVVTVYENMEDGSREAIMAFACSCGKAGGHNTPQGTFYTSESYRWRRMIDNTYAQYAVRVNNLIMFHSVPYKEMKPNTLKWAQYNLLGSKASLGCIRLSVADVKWIYDNCQEGTKVVIYEDMEEELPIEKPETFKISYDMRYRGWDPTDPDPENPWNKE